MFKKIFSTSLLLVMFSVTVVPQAVFAKKYLREKPLIPVTHAEALPSSEESTSTVSIDKKVDCTFTQPEKPKYAAQLFAVRKKGKVAGGELFETKVYMVNKGNTPWFSATSGCTGPMVNLGTDKKRDRESVFYTNDLLWKSNWGGANRIKMETPRVEPEDIATFSFWSKAPQEEGFYREYYTPVAEHITWIDSGTFSTDMSVGEDAIDPAKKDLLQYIETSTNLSKIDLSGEKNILVDLSEQKMWLKIGEYSIKEYRVSSGSSKHPTPVGATKISVKQEVRVAASSPHYIMPKFMMFRKGGYGFHALPSLANDHGVFWREALNHIGSPRSHGCIRLLPADAEFAFNFAEVGTNVKVQY
jgi:lipoprotein-anchoring transpeptidase ErfK/SrfK